MSGSRPHPDPNSLPAACLAGAAETPTKLTSAECLPLSERVSSEVLAAAEARGAGLAAVIEGEVIPRLLMLHRNEPSYGFTRPVPKSAMSAEAKPAARAAPVSPGQLTAKHVADLTELVRRDAYSACQRYVMALRDKGRFCVSICGDGDFLMAPGCLWTAVHYGIPMLHIVNNNSTWGNDEVHQIEVAHNRNRPKENAWIGQAMRDPIVDFATVAREVSEDSNRASGGEIGMRSASRLPDAFVAQVGSLKPGEVSPTLLRSGAGWHVLKLIDRRDTTGIRITQTRPRHILLRLSPQLSADVAKQRLAGHADGIRQLPSRFARDVAIASSSN